MRRLKTGLESMDGKMDGLKDRQNFSPVFYSALPIPDSLVCSGSDGSNWFGSPMGGEVGCKNGQFPIG